MIESNIVQKFVDIFNEMFNASIKNEDVNIQKTRPEIVGDFTVNVFPFLKHARLSPEALANTIGELMIKELDFIENYNVIKGFLNFELKDSLWIKFLQNAHADINYGFKEVDSNQKPILIEYSSPNTNKPLHLGHIRNNLLGFSIAEIFKASGRNVVKVNLVNDRGIHICKSMLAWERWGDGETPESTGIKGDHFVGKFYVMFDQYFTEEVKSLVDCGTLEELAVKNSVLMHDAQKMLQMWERGDKYVTKLWIKMNNWVCSGFEETYKRMGIDFDKVYYESDTYLLGKDIVQKGLSDGNLFQKDDGSVWADLTDEGLDQKLLLRADGTSVYMTQDLGTADLRQKDFSPEKMLYVVGNEQNYHFDVLKRVLKKLGYSYSEDIVHISYGMVELPEGKMKSREGTVVDADDLMEEMVETAMTTTMELGKAKDFPEQERKILFEQIGLGALKYFILKVDPKKTMLFDPKESIDFNGNTGPFIQYSCARINSLLAKENADEFSFVFNFKPQIKERDLLVMIAEFPSVVQSAADQYSPAIIANYIYSLAREYNQFYHDYPVLKEENPDIKNFRLQISATTKKVLEKGLGLLGISAPERM